MKNTINKFIRGHTSNALNDYQTELQSKLNQSLPFDVHLKRYFKQHKSIGQRDRFQIQENAFNLIRYKEYLDTISPKPLTWESRMETLFSQKFHDQKHNKSLKANVRCSCPSQLFNLLCESFGEAKAFEYANAMNKKAPLTVRVNPLKISREQLVKKWEKIDNYKIRTTEYSPYGIQFLSQPQSLYDSADFKKGYFEVQDEASQLCSLRVQCEPGQKVLDYCAGSGGKSLAFASQMEGKGQLYLHDVRIKSLEEAQKRLNRAGIQNVQFHSDESKFNSLKKKIDWLVLDVPCSGTGTLRRNPDLKWKFNLEYLDHMVMLQQSIFDNAIKYLKKDGKLVYITCSLLAQENMQQIVKFCSKYNMEIVDGKHFQTFPEEAGMDAFFSAVLQYKQ